jgi:hypothetical protein
MPIAGLVKFEVLPKWLPKFSQLMKMIERHFYENLSFVIC